LFAHACGVRVHSDMGMHVMCVCIPTWCRVGEHQSVQSGCLQLRQPSRRMRMHGMCRSSETTPETTHEQPTNNPRTTQENSRTTHEQPTKNNPRTNTHEQARRKWRQKTCRWMPIRIISCSSNASKCARVCWDAEEEKWDAEEEKSFDSHVCAISHKPKA